MKRETDNRVKRESEANREDKRPGLRLSANSLNRLRKVAAYTFLLSRLPGLLASGAFAFEIEMNLWIKGTPRSTAIFKHSFTCIAWKKGPGTLDVARERENTKTKRDERRGWETEESAEISQLFPDATIRVVTRTGFRELNLRKLFEERKQTAPYCLAREWMRAWWNTK